jgi:hypothetical protein
MAYGVQSPNQQSLKPVSRLQNKNQYDTFYFSDFHENATITYREGGVMTFFAANGAATTTNPTNGLTGFGITACSGTVQMSTGSTSNTTGYVGVATGLSSTISANLLGGLQTPSSSSLVSKYEIETMIRTDSTIFNSGVTLSGTVIFGFTDDLSFADPSIGVWLEYLTDGTTNDTTFQVAWKTSGNTKQRSNTGVTFSANTVYRLYLSSEVNTAGTFTTTYKIKNMTTGANTEGTASPATANRNPSDGTIGIAPVLMMSKRGGTSYATPILMWVDYFAVRIRKPISREILLGTF